MKDQNYSFMGGDILSKGMANRKNSLKAFNFDKAANIIKEYLKDHPDLIAEAGLEGDWAYTGGVIFRDGKPVTDEYTYLSSTWATPTLVLSWEGEDQMSFDCSCPENKRFHSSAKWDKKAIKILNS